MTLLIMAISTAVWKVLYNFKIKRSQEARHNQFFFQNVQNNETFEIFKMIKNMFKVKFGTKANSNMQNGGVYFIYFRLKIATLCGKFWPENRNCQLKLKVGT